MTIKDQTDPVRVGEALFYNVFHHVFHDDGARAHFGFSQINFFCSAEGMPAWNLWFCKDPGAYQLSLIEAGVAPGGGLGMAATESCPDSVIAGRFFIRYFPAADDPLLDQYSRAEARLRRGPLFDRTGTPSMDGQDRFDDSSFVVGYIDWRTDPRRRFLELSCVAPNRWKEMRPNSSGAEIIDRYVPGWDLTWALFDKLVLGFCYTFRTAPLAAVAAQKQWMRFDIDQDNGCEPQSDGEIELLQTVAGLAIHDDAAGCMDPDAYLDAVRRRLDREGFEHLQETRHPQTHGKGRVCAGWWSARDLLFSQNPLGDLPHCCYHDH